MLLHTGSYCLRKYSRSFPLVFVVSELGVASLCDFMIAITHKNVNHKKRYHCVASTQLLKKDSISLPLQVDYS